MDQKLLLPTFIRLCKEFRQQLSVLVRVEMGQSFFLRCRRKYTALVNFNPFRKIKEALAQGWT